MTLYGIFALIVLFLRFSFTEGADTDGSGAEVYRSWEEEPDRRGTMSILLSCVITLSICVWTSIHLNVVPSPTSARLFFMKGFWMLAGIFTPEVTMWLALNQFEEARILLKAMEKGPVKEENDGTQENTDAELGEIGTEGREGICNSEVDLEAAYDLSERQDAAAVHNYEASGPDEVVSNDQRSQDAAKQPTVIEVASTEVTEETARLMQGSCHSNESMSSGGPRKRKTPFTMKSALFVVMGGCVFYPPESLGLEIIQPLTLSAETFGKLYNEGYIDDGEVNDYLVEDKSKSDGLGKTLVLTQAVWLLIQCIGRAVSHLPIPLLEIHTCLHVLCALGTYIFWWHKPQNVLHPVVITSIPPSEATRLYLAYLSYAGIENAYIQKLPAKLTLAESRYPNSVSTRLRRSVFLFEHRSKKGSVSEWKWWQKVLLFPFYSIAVLYYWRQTLIIARPTPAFDMDLLTARTAENRKQLRIASRQVQYRSTMWSFLARMTHQSGETFDGVMIAIGFCVMTLYGGLHTAAWKQHFPTEIEGILWFVSSIVTTSFAAAATLTAVLMDELDEYTKGKSKEYKAEEGVVYGVLASAFAIWFPALGLAFILSRIYLVVESFISLRSLHVDAFKTVPWSNYWPHL
ncbi:hypothetical protein BJ508DRAFT_158859 [Ascobolus immersus RN42]|uniref:Uncharacterized protein n=1 Tax=Ascobolus immersus RN42 TaxID=1160509 RepID=A0A3N4IIN4_ASCIM|nr:hypothetical protein BJ508DRAFT_158859 [Ascobolus immersus RN42]